MSGNSFGQMFRVTTCGESHGGAVAVIIDGCPPHLALNEADIQVELDRRKPGQSAITTPRTEADTIHILSGVFDGVTTGTPILLLAYNKDAKSEDYLHLQNTFRPSHADYTYLMKYGIRDYRGSGRASARETLARVAAGSIAKKWLLQIHNIEILSYVEQVGHIKANIDMQKVQLADIEQNIIRCPNQEVAAQMITLVEQVRDSGDSIGGVIRCIIRNVPAGLGEPVFDKLHADLGKAMLSINAVKGFEIGSGFAGVELVGSLHNDALTFDNNEVTTKTNNAGGIVGGISNGEDIYCRIAFKSVSTINKAQDTLNTNLESVQIEAHGRHDPCVLPRAVPVVDAMAALVIMDHYLRHLAYASFLSPEL
jgi:chorismate synthase